MASGIPLQAALVVKNPSAGDLRVMRFNPWMGKIPWSRSTAACSSILAWRILWTEEPGGLQSLGLKRVRPD